MIVIAPAVRSTAFQAGLRSLRRSAAALLRMRLVESRSVMSRFVSRSVSIFNRPSK